MHMKQLKKGPMGSFLCSYVNVHTNGFFLPYYLGKALSSSFPCTYTVAYRQNLNFSDEAEAKINSLVGGQSILPGILAAIFEKNGPDGVQIWSGYGPDLVQISRSRPSGPILATTHYLRTI